jgi:hypothetical protein
MALVVAKSCVVLLFSIWGSDLGPETARLDRVPRGFLSFSMQTSGQCGCRDFTAEIADIVV